MHIDAQHEKVHPDGAPSPSRARPGPADSLAAFYAAHDGKVSDKWRSYLDVYSEVFRPYRDRPVRILEIGIQNGGSLEIWRQFFPRAEIIVGCDVNPKCAALTFDDPAIHVVIGDANLAGVMTQIAHLSDSFDIIIDDGSHLSSDIVKSFALYFPRLAPGGLYVAEDLHCSYWAQFEGGLQAPYSSLSFFKRLSDMVNIEHWGADLPPDQPLGYFAEIYGVTFDPSALARIDAVSFYNSICIVRKAQGSRNTIGPRVLVGQIALVHCPGAQNGAACRVMDEAANPWGPSAPLAERLTAEAHERAARAACVAAALPRLQSALAHLWGNVLKSLRHHASRTLGADSVRSSASRYQRRIGWVSRTFDARIASARYRCLLPAAGLDAFGWESVFLRSAGAAREQLGPLDCLIFVKLLEPDWLPLALEMRAQGKPVIVDLCDNIFMPGYGSGGVAPQTDLFRAFASCASAVVTTGPALSALVRELAPDTLRIVEIPDQVECRETVEALLDRLAEPRLERKKKHKSPFKHLRKVRRLTRRRGDRLLALFSGAGASSAEKARHGAESDGANEAVEQALRRRIVWFGNSGAPYSDSGMLAILRVAPYLQRVAQELPIELVVVSDNARLFKRVIRPLPVATRFVEWSILGVRDEIASADLVILPSSTDAFSMTKSANRAVLALSLGTPVVASWLPSLEPLRSCVGIDDWVDNIRAYLTDPDRRSRDLAAARAVIERDYSPERIAGQWHSLLSLVIHGDEVAAESCRAPRVGLTIFINLVQDLDLLLPVVEAARASPGLAVRVLVSAYAASRSPRIVAALDRLAMSYRLVDLDPLAIGYAVQFDAREALLTASESSAKAHRAAHALVQLAAKAGAHTYTLQHGVDNIGLTYFDHVDGCDVGFASDVVFTWLPPDRLPAWVTPETRRKVVGIGRTAKPVTAPQPLPINAGGRPLIGIFENLHWHRYNDAYRSAFVNSTVALATARPDCHFLIKPHHAGMWGIVLAERLAGTANITVASPEDCGWEPFTAPQILPSLAAAITTPSTVALDAALIGVPVAVVFGGEPEPVAYEPLPLLRSSGDWLTFIDRALCREATVLAALEGYVATTVLPGDAVARLLERIVRDKASDVMADRNVVSRAAAATA